MKYKLWLIALALLLSVSVVAAIDIAPSVTLVVSNTTVENVVVVTAVAVDVGDNAGIKHIQFLQNGMLNYTHNCAQKSTCTATRTFISNIPANRSYIAMVEDLGGNKKSTPKCVSCNSLSSKSLSNRTCM